MVHFIGALVVASLTCLGLFIFDSGFAHLGMGWHFLNFLNFLTYIAVVWFLCHTANK